MAKFILGRKLGMSTIYSQEKGALNVTLVECEPNVVTQIRNSEKDGYEALQVGLLKPKISAKGRSASDGKNQKSKIRNNFLKTREFKGEIKDIKVGDTLDISQFEVGDKVKVSGITKGKGFQGVMKRHNFKGSPHSHGHKHDWRAPGSIGSSFPEHVIKGKKMAGRMGGERSSVKNLEIVEIDKENEILFLCGAVPGAKGRIVEIVAL
ncbi:MAG: 50S ribosomal protein L3 [Candidatus Moranbacteria bacterium RIFOXYB1_FULL_43_19]|nr:MAG: 50S ribosomal protein L3 [Candidatus Moranbacteria bacterium RIFOXYB1_FULL_43_19]OGI34161.1 MAG: 50S ribosomal protein L3 [Candidatus Moranbacteria bacterium RIFOXYC1_FULL_44_13]OGI38348.1 MAG: 50S ribosomal protein L3 [Candidatus Moranbacteria bacterium RIFOXYD1_FULL_44_12]